MRRLLRSRVLGVSMVVLVFWVSVPVAMAREPSPNVVELAENSSVDTEQVQRDTKEDVDAAVDAATSKNDKTMTVILIAGAVTLVVGILYWAFRPESPARDQVAQINITENITLSVDALPVSEGTATDVGLDARQLGCTASVNFRF